MRIYAFAEHFPSTHKPYFDTQFAQFLRDGHDLQVFALGRFDAALSARVVEAGLRERTTYCPHTLRHLPALGPAALAGMAGAPLRQARSLARLWDPARPARRNLLDAARALLLPPAAPDLCLVHDLATAQAFAFLRALYPSARVALYFHGGEIAGAVDEAEGRRALAAVDRVFTNTSFSAAQVVRRGCDPARVVVNPVGFRLDDYRPEPGRPYRPGGVLRLLSVGRLSPEKGLGFALEAVARLRAEGRALSYRIVGAGPEGAALQARAAALGLAGVVTFAGELPSERVAHAYREADALLLPSVPTGRWAETQACVAQEAMLMRLPVVATAAGGVPESLAPALRALCVPPADAEALADRVRRLLTLPEAELARLGAAGRAYAEAGYDVRRLNRALLRRALA